MARRRRKVRISPSRSASGRLSRAGEHPEFAPTLVRRLRDAALAGVRDQEWGSELGRLYLFNHIEPAQYAAGRKWSEMARNYQIALNAPRSDPRPASFQRLGHGHDADPDSETGRQMIRRQKDTVEKTQAALRALRRAGALAESVTRNVCEHDRCVSGTVEMNALTRGLSELASHLGLTTKPRTNGHRILTDR